ncbi:hypothetical protein CLOP_g17146 [Closterium sp. NIES-67]|nr:hypothetical protein CLOP_g17146 [Closterium sp. NIES-67]
MGVGPTVPGATPEQVVGQPSVEDFKFLGAVASAGGWEWKAEAEGQGNGEVEKRRWVCPESGFGSIVRVAATWPAYRTAWTSRDKRCWSGEPEGSLLSECRSSRARGGIAVSHFASQVCKWVGLVKGGVRCRTASARGPPDAAGRAAKRPWAWSDQTSKGRKSRGVVRVKYETRRDTQRVRRRDED